MSTSKPNAAVRSAAILLGTLAIVIAVTSMTLTGERLGRENATLVTNNNALVEQVKSLGERPIAPTAEKAIAAIDGKAGSQGLTGLTGDKGDTGAKGDTGLTGLTGVAGTAGLFTVGENGADGVSITGDTGATGETGATGDTGAKGDTGLNGESPYGWTTVHADGTTERCNRADPFDPLAPTYTCAFAPPVTPAP